TAEAATLHGGQAGGPDLRGVTGGDPPGARVSRGGVAGESFPDVQCAVRSARHARRHRGVALRALWYTEERDDLGHAVTVHLGQGVGARVRYVPVPVGVGHGVRVGVGEGPGRELDPGGRPLPVLVTDVGDDLDPASAPLRQTAWPGPARWPGPGP